MADRVKVTLEAQFMPCTLTFEEREHKGRELADLMAEHDRLEDSKKSAADHFKSKISETDAKARGVYLVIRQGYEMREVQCRRVQDYDRRTVEVVREDTGEVVSSRTMNPTEVKEFEIAAQGRLFDEPRAPRPRESIDREVDALGEKAVAIAEKMVGRDPGPPRILPVDDEAGKWPSSEEQLDRAFGKSDTHADDPAAPAGDVTGEAHEKARVTKGPAHDPEGAADPSGEAPDGGAYMALIDLDHAQPTAAALAVTSDAHLIRAAARLETFPSTDDRAYLRYGMLMAELERRHGLDRVAEEIVNLPPATEPTPANEAASLSEPPLSDIPAGRRSRESAKRAKRTAARQEEYLRQAATAAPAREPDAREPGYQAGFSEPRAGGWPDCLCGHPHGSHNGYTGCLHNGCDCKSYRDSDPLGLAHHDPRATKIDDSVHDRTAAAYAAAAVARQAPDETFPGEEGDTNLAEQIDAGQEVDDAAL